MVFKRLNGKSQFEIPMVLVYSPYGILKSIGKRR
jgi:hypothetical protein